LNKLKLIWENRKEGMYLKVPVPPPNDFNIRDVKRNFLDDGIMNADFKRIKQVIEKHANRFEFVGEHFERFDEAKAPFVILTSRPKVASIFIESTFALSGLNLTVKDIEFILNKAGVTVGIEWSEISTLINKRLYGKKVVVARSIAPINGENAKIMEMVAIDPNAKPFKLSDGSVDFHQMENIQQIGKHELIAKRIPPTAGKIGTDIFGQPIPPTPGDNVFLPKGSYTVISDDNSELRSTCAGYLYRENKNIAVGRLFIVPGNVDFKCGNINYSGDVLVRGSVLSDFKIEAQGNITIEGTVEGAEIKSNEGSIIIKGGLFGKDKAIVEAKESIEIGMAQDCKIICENDVILHKQLTKVDVKARSLLSKAGRKTLVNSCALTLYENLSLFQIGTSQGSATTVKFLNKKLEESLEKFEQFNKAIAKIQNDMEAYQRRLKTMKNILKNSTEVAPRSREELKKVLIQYETSKNKRDLVENKRKVLSSQTQQVESLPGKIEVQEIRPLLIVEMHGDGLEIKDELRDVVIEWRNGAIVQESMEKNI
jgi:uncharacterized protein (DUF342 family)